jgi:hypothetical protein
MKMTLPGEVREIKQFDAIAVEPRDTAVTIQTTTPAPVPIPILKMS